MRHFVRTGSHVYQRSLFKSLLPVIASTSRIVGPISRHQQLAINKEIAAPHADDVCATATEMISAAMAEEVQKKEAQETVAQVEEVEVVTDVQPAEKTAMPADKKEAPVPLPETEEEDMKPQQQQVDDEASNKETLKSGSDDTEKMPESGSFKEESTKVADLVDNEKKALDELKQLVQEALNKHEFSDTATPAAAVAAPKEEEKKDAEAVAVAEQEQASESEIVTGVIDEKKTTVAADAADDDGAKTLEAIEETIVAVSSEPEPEPEAEAAAASETEVMVPEEVSIWGIPLLGDERSDVILLKFLRARDFKVKEAFTMLSNTIRWRKEFGIDELIEQDLGNDLEQVVFMHGFDKQGHPICYNVYGEFRNKELYQKSFSDEEKRLKFLKWRIQFLERSIRKLDFRPGGISTIVQINDLKNSPGPAKWELRQATKQALQLFQDNYPEFVAKQLFINVPWWYLAVNRMISPFLTQRTRSKFVFAGPSKSAETLLRYIAAEHVPVKYGGLSKDGEFSATDAVTEITVKPAAKHTVEFPVTEACDLTWEVRVVGWEVSYSAEFVPNTEGSYTVIIQKGKKLTSNNTEQAVICDSYKINEPGKVVITIDNPTSKKKMLLYRLKTKPSSAPQSF